MSGGCQGVNPCIFRGLTHHGEVWWAWQDSNLQPDRYERPALTIELPARPARIGASL